MRKIRLIFGVFMPVLAVVLAGGTVAAPSPAAATETPKAPTVTIDSEPTGEFPGQLLVSPGEDFSLTATASGGRGPYTFTWSGPDRFAAAGPTISLTATAAHQGIFQATVTDEAGLTGTAEFRVGVRLEQPTMSVVLEQQVYETGQGVDVVAELTTPVGPAVLDGGVVNFFVTELNVTGGADLTGINPVVPVENGRAAFSFAAGGPADYRVTAYYAGTPATSSASVDPIFFTVTAPNALLVAPSKGTVDRRGTGQPAEFTVHARPNELIRIDVNPGSLALGPITTDAAGTASIQVTVPAGFPTGDQTLSFIGEQSGRTGMALLRVGDSGPTVRLSPGTVDRAFGGQTVIGAVSGFAPETLRVWLDGREIGPALDRLLAPDFELSIRGDFPLGQHTVRVVGMTSGLEAAATFEVLDTGLPDPVPGLMDVRKDTLFYDEIVWMVNNGISTGFPDGSYRPYQPINRDAMAAFLYRLAGSPYFEPPAVPPFADVERTNQFYKEITWLAAEEISTGWEDGTFRPYQPINRDAMAAFLYRLAGSPDFEPADPARFSDVPVGTRFHKEINWAAANGITTGYSDGSFHPVQAIDREAVAAFLFRFDQLLGQ